MSQRSKYCALSITIFIAGIFFLNPIPLLRPEFWAEDGLEFFAASLKFGFGSLFEIGAGNWHFLARVFAWLSSLFPVVLIPSAYAVFSVVMAIAIIVFLYSEKLDWIFSFHQRVLLSILFLLAPGSMEVFLNLSNWHYLFLLLAFVILLYRPFKLNYPQVGIFILLGLSCPSIGAAGLFAALLWFIYRNSEYLKTAGLLVAIQLFQLLLSLMSNATVISGAVVHEGFLARNHINVHSPVSAVFAWAHRLISNFLVLPAIGPNYGKIFLTLPSILYYIPLVLLIGFLGLVLKNRLKVQRDLAFVLMAMSLAGSAIYFMLYFGRDYSSQSLLRNSSETFWYLRYSFVSAFLGAIFWMKIWEIFDWKLRRHLSLAVGILFICVWSFHWKLTYLRSDLGWPAQSKAIQEARDLVRSGQLPPAQIVGDVVVHPLGWARFSVTIGH